MHSRRVSTASSRTRGPVGPHPNPPVPGGWPQTGYSLPVPQPHPHTMDGWSARFPAPMPLPDYQQHHVPAPVSTRSASARHAHPLHEINKQQAAPYRHGGTSPTGGRSHGLDASCKKDAPAPATTKVESFARPVASDARGGGAHAGEEHASCENNCSDDSYTCDEVGNDDCDAFLEGCEDGENKEKRLLCQFFLRTGTCAFGNRCKYFHPRNHKPPQLNLLGYPLRPGDKSCSFYMKTGWCAFGATCKFHHPPPENQPSSGKGGKNQPPPPRVDMRMPHPPGPYPPGPPPMGVMNATWPMVPPNLWYHPAVPSAPMMPMPLPMPTGAMMRPVPPVQPWKANKSCKDMDKSYHSGRSSHTSFDRRRSSDGDRTSSSSDDTHTEMEHGGYGGMPGRWDPRVW